VIHLHSPKVATTAERYTHLLTPTNKDLPLVGKDKLTNLPDKQAYNSPLLLIMLPWYWNLHQIYNSVIGDSTEASIPIPAIPLDLIRLTERLLLLKQKKK